MSKAGEGASSGGPANPAPKQVVSRRKPDSRSMIDYLQRTLCVALSDGRLLCGRLVAFDPHMNIVLSGAVEFPAGANAESALHTMLQPRLAYMKDTRRDVGLSMIRGEHVSNVMASKRKADVVPQATNAPGGAAAVPGAALAKSNVPQLPKPKPQRRQREDDE